MKLKFMQEGGAMPMEGTLAPAPAPAQEQATAGPNPDLLMQLVQELINALGPEGAAMVAQMIMQTLQGGATAPEQPALQRKGGVLRRIK